MSLARNTASIFLTRIGNAGLGFFISVLVSNGLGPHYKGLYSLWVHILVYLPLFLTLGLDSAAEYFVSRGRKSPPEILRRLLAPILILLPILLVAGGALAWYGGPPLAPGGQGLFLLLALLLLLAEFHHRLLMAFVHGLKEFNTYNIASFASSVILLVLLVAGYSVVPRYESGGLGPGATGASFLTYALVAYLLSRYLLLLPMFLKLGRHYGVFRRPRPEWDGGFLRESFYYGLRAHPGILVFVLIFRLDFYLLWLLQGAGEVGVYSVAAAMAELLWFLPQAAQTVLFPEIARTTEEHERARTQTLCRIAFLLMALACTASAAVVPLLIHLLYKPEFAPAIPSFWILLPGTLIFGIAMILRSDLAGRGFPGKASLALSYGLLLNGALNFLLIPPLGIEGAALASTLSYAFATIYMITSYVRITGAPWSALVIPRREDGRLLWQRLRRFGGNA